MGKFPLCHFAERFCAAGFPSACLEGFSPSCSSKTGFCSGKPCLGKTALSFSLFFFFFVIVFHPEAEWEFF